MDTPSATEPQWNFRLLAWLPASIGIALILASFAWFSFTSVTTQEGAGLGDFFGGTVGTVISLSSALLFLAALLMQAHDLRLQRLELAAQREQQELQVKELERSRKTGVVMGFVDRWLSDEIQRAASWELCAYYGESSSGNLLSLGHFITELAKRKGINGRLEGSQVVEGIYKLQSSISMLRGLWSFDKVEPDLLIAVLGSELSRLHDAYRRICTAIPEGEHSLYRDLIASAHWLEEVDKLIRPDLSILSPLPAIPGE